MKTKLVIILSCLVVLTLSAEEEKIEEIVSIGSKIPQKKITQMIKSSKVKVQASVQGDSIRVNGKKRDDLQQVIEMLKEASFDLPLQFENFRD